MNERKRHKYSQRGRARERERETERDRESKRWVKEYEEENTTEKPICLVLRCAIKGSREFTVDIFRPAIIGIFFPPFL